MPKPNNLRRFFSSSGWTIVTVLIWEVIEELIEYAIAFVISNTLAIFFTKVAALMVSISATQGIKVTIRKFLIPHVKKLIKKDFKKMSKFSQFFVTLGKWINANKKTITGTVCSAASATATGAIVSTEAFQFSQLMIGSFNITPIIVGILVLVGSLLGVYGKGVESIETYTARKADEKAVKNEQQLIDLINKELDEEDAANAKPTADEIAYQQKKEALKLEMRQARNKATTTVGTTEPKV